VASRLTALLLPVVIVVTAACSTTAAAQARRAPDHLIVMVFDQMRPDYIDRFDLPNFKRLRSASRNYPDAYVGHLGAQTVVAHVVIPTGLQPKAMPWVDEAMVDTKGLIGAPGLAYKTQELTRDQMFKLLASIPREQFLQARIHDQLGGSVIAVGEKNYATNLFGGPYASSIVMMTKASGGCTPDGVNVPPYIANNPRFTVECADPYGTGYPTVYTLDGSRFVPGHDPAHQGGDVWTADAAIEVLNREPWSALLLTFGAIDKIGHMLGEQDDHGLQSVPSEYRLADTLRTADAQLGRVLDALDKKGLSDRTLVVVTADHGGQRDEAYLGNNGTQSCCPFENVAGAVKAPYWIEHLGLLGKLRTAYGATSLNLWMADSSAANEKALVTGMKDVSGIVEIYAKRQDAAGFRYERLYSRLDQQAQKFQTWAQKHNAELVATMAGPSGPDLVGLLADGFGFGRIGDHGGAQELVQRIPMIIHVPGEPPAQRPEALRLMDLAPEISKLLGLR
jgi:hypothetical protein